MRRLSLSRHHPKPINIRSGSSLALCMVLITGVLISAEPAYAGDAQASGDVVIYREPGVVVSIPSSKQSTKEEPAWRKAVGSGQVTTKMLACEYQNACYMFPSSTIVITPPGGSSGSATSEGQTNYIPWRFAGGRPSSIDYYNTNSSSSWYGSNPWNCTSLKHQDIWDIDYVGLSWSYGGGPSGTASFGSGRIGYENTVSSTWRVTHSVQHVYLAVTGGYVYWTGYEVHGSYQFGGSFYTADGYDSAWLPD